MNLCEILSRHVDERGDKPAIIDGSNTVTYAQLEQRVGRVAAYLSSLGVKTGDRVLAFVPMGIDLYALLLGTLRLGAIVVFVDPGMKKEALNQAVTSANPKLFLGITKAHLLRFISKPIRRIPTKIRVGGHRLEKLLCSVNQSHDIVDVTPDHGALLTFTSGSTGTPKGVLRSHGALLAQHKALANVLGTQANDVDLPCLPIVLLNTLAAGATAIIPPIGARVADTNPRRLAQLIIDYNVTTSAGSPAIYEPLANYCIKHQLTLPSIKHLFIGGAPVPPSLLHLLEPIIPNGDTCVVYGSTEAEPISHLDGKTVLQETAHETDRGAGLCVGIPTTDVQLRLDEGEILVAGAHVNPGYYENPEADKRYKVKDSSGTIWHRTGDIGRIDPQGRLWLLGRRDTLVIKNGITLYPTALELAARAQPGVNQAAFLEIGEKTVLVIEGDSPDLAELKALHVCIDEVTAVPHIPTDRRHNAKIDYDALRQRL